MAKPLDLQEQEQLDEFKHFWKQYGGLISLLAIVVLGSFAAWNGWQYWQRTQSAQAAVMFEEVERSIVAGEPTKIERSLADMKERYGSTVYAQQAGLAVAKAMVDKGNTDGARAALAGVVAQSSDEGLRSVAKLRLAGLLLEKKLPDEALQQLAGEFPAEFVALAADRRGDILLAQGKKPEARSEYEKAWKGLDERSDYRRLVEFKLNALGGDPVGAKLAQTAAAPASGTSAP